MRIYSTRDLVWAGLELRLGRRVLATVKPDPEWPKLYRVHTPSHVSDTVNLTRAKDAAVCLALACLNLAKMAA